MKIIIFLFLSFSCFFTAIGQSENPKYDSLLAASLGGDDYGMKPYFFVILKTGSNNTKDKKELDRLFKGHMENIGRMVADRKLFIAGPLSKNQQNYRGLFFFNVKTIEEVNSLLENDPAIKEKLFNVEIFNWYGSAAIPTYLPNHEKIEKKKM